MSPHVIGPLLLVSSYRKVLRIKRDLCILTQSWKVLCRCDLLACEAGKHYPGDSMCFSLFLKNHFNCFIYVFQNLISQLNTLIYSVEFPAYEQLLLEFRQRISYLGTQLEKLSTLMYKDFWLIRDNFLDNSRIKVMNRLIHIEYTMVSKWYLDSKLLFFYFAYNWILEIL